MRFMWKGIIIRKFISRQAKFNLFLFDYNFFRFLKITKYRNFVKSFSFLCKKPENHWIISYQFFKKTKKNCACFKNLDSSKLYDALLYHNTYWPKSNFQKDYFVNIEKITFFDALFRLLIDTNISKIFFSKLDSKIFLPSCLNLNIKRFYKKITLEKKFFNLKNYLILSRSGLIGPLFFKKKDSLYQKISNNSLSRPLFSKKKEVYSKIYKFLSNL